MRPIDADELKTAFPTCDNSKSILIASVRATINHMPTVGREWLHDLLQDAIDAGIITETQASRLMDRIAEDNT